MLKQTRLARTFFFSSLALMLGLGLANAVSAQGREAGSEVARPPAPEGCEGVTPPVCAEADIGGFTYKYYFKP